MALDEGDVPRGFIPVGWERTPPSIPTAGPHQGRPEACTYASSSLSVVVLFPQAQCLLSDC